MHQKINVIIPMAGAGNRFLQEGYTIPKPLISVQGRPMILQVINNLNIANAQYTFLIQENHNCSYNLQDSLKAVIPGCNVITIKTITEGPACTALLAEKFINNNKLIIVNCDQIIRDFNISNFLEFVEVNQADGVLGAFISSSKKNSYMKLDANGEVIELKEKIVISNIATNGLHFWKNGLDFISSASEMINNNERYNNEFYIAPTYNYLINRGKKILPYFYNLHMPIGTPEDLKKYENTYENLQV